MTPPDMTDTPMKVVTTTEDGLLEGMAALGFHFLFLTTCSINRDGRGPYAILLDSRMLGAPHRVNWIASRYDAEGEETHRFVVLR